MMQESNPRTALISYITKISQMIEIPPMQTLYVIYDRYQYIIRLVVGREKPYYDLNTGSLEASMLETNLFSTV